MTFTVRQIHLSRFQFFHEPYVTCEVFIIVVISISSLTFFRLEIFLLLLLLLFLLRLRPRNGLWLQIKTARDQQSR